MKVTRNPGPTTYYQVRGDKGEFLWSLHHREVQALVAARAGHVFARYRHTRAPYFSDSWLETECEVYGVGRGTLSGLQFHGYLAKPDDEGPVGLTDLGTRVLDEVLTLAGTDLPTMVGAAA